ncbi:MAG: hypothetical protein QF566_05845, partial [Candidatus Thalassarchaeaceae archaeon]|nr:hypothetical protein [Candidatus Thalassarchaeaceae archaeon]
LLKGDVHHVCSFRASMAGGGDSVQVSPHDLSIIVGAIGLVGAIAISLFALPLTIDFGESTSTHEVRTLTLGHLGSNDDVVIDATPLCDGNDSCEITFIRIIAEDGTELTSVTIIEEAEDGSFSTSIPVSNGGTVTLEMSGQGIWDLDITAQRQIPIQFLPSLFALFLLVWGVWRKLQEGPEDADIEEIADSA